MRFNPFIHAILPVVLLAGGANTSVAQETGKLLPPTYIVGKEYQVTVDQNMVMDMSALGQAVGQPQLAGKTTTAMTMGMTMRCEEHTVPGQKVVKTRFSRVKMDVNAAGQEMKYDSDNPADEASPFASSMAPLLASEFSIVYDKDDKVISVEGLDELASQAAPGAPQLFDTEQFKQLANPAASLGIPAAGIEVGKAWENVIAMNLGAGIGKMKASYDLKYTKDEEVDGHQCAVIDYTIDMEMDVKAGDETAGPMKMTMTASDARGDMKFDKEIRHFRSGSADMKMTMTMNNPANPAESLTIPMELKQTYKLTALKNLE